MGRNAICLALYLSARHSRLVSYGYRFGWETYSSLLFSYFASVSGAPNEQAENQGTFLGGVASVSVEYLEDPKGT